MSISSMVDSKLAREARSAPLLPAKVPLPHDVLLTSPVKLARGSTFSRRTALASGASVEADEALEEDAVVAAGTTLPRGSILGSEVPKPVGVHTNIVNQLTRWIPSESILLYVALLALFEPLRPSEAEAVSELDFTSRWIGFGVFVLITIVLVIALTWGKANRDPNLSFTFPRFEVVVAPLAFAAWAAALPDTPLLDFPGYDNAIGGYALLVVTVVISVGAWMLKKSPEFDQVMTSQ